MSLFDIFKQKVTSRRNAEINKDPSDLKDTIISGEVSVYSKQINTTENYKPEQVALLTPREHDLFVLLLEGFTLKESAKQLSIKYSTANTHMTGLYRKLGVNSRAELIINYRNSNGINNNEH